MIQPLLGKAADAWGYPVTYTLSAAFQVFAIPFTWLARGERAEADVIEITVQSTHIRQNKR